MVNRNLLLRIALDLTAAGLLLVALAYYWLGNTIHELVGTAMFALLVVHNLIHRRWYGRPRRPQAMRTALDKLLVFALLSAIAVLLATSVLISHTLPLLLSPEGAATARRMHLLAAYWAFVLVAIHIGIRWRIVRGFFRGLPAFAGDRIVSFTWRLAALAIAGAGVYSSSELGVGAKLLSQTTMEWWDFAESVPGFFLHHVAVAGLHAFVAHHVFDRISAIGLPSMPRISHGRGSAALPPGSS